MRTFWAATTALILTLAGTLACESHREQSAVVEGLFYKGLATLAQHGVLVRLNGFHQAGSVAGASRVEVYSRHGAMRLVDADASLGLFHSWAWGWRPELSFYASRAVVARRPHKTADKEPTDSVVAEAPRFHSPPFVAQVAIAKLRVMQKLPWVAAAGEVSSRPGEQFAELVAGRDHWRAFIKVKKSGDEWSGEIAAPNIPVAYLGSLAPKRVQIESGTASALIDFVRDGQATYGKMATRIDSMCLEQRRFGEGKACGVKVSGAARGALGGNKIYIDAAHAQLNGVDVWAHGLVPRAPDGEFDLTLQVPAQPVQRVLNAIPRIWRTGLFNTEFGGTFAATLALQGSGDGLDVAPEFHFAGVSVKHAPAGQDPRALAGGTAWTLTFPYGTPRTVYLGRGGGSFVPLAEVSPLLREAIRVSEDANFYGHDGFDRGEISKALTDMKDGGAARGASTLTQQLAKNLFFDGDRNLSRKIEEAIVTASLEASVSKSRLFEIYVNVVEWGDGVYGVGPAAAHYFGKSPADLTAKEAAFLAGLLPAPRRSDRELKQSGRSAWAEKRVLRVLHMLCSIGKVTGDACDDDSGQVQTVLGSAATPSFDTWSPR